MRRVKVNVQNIFICSLYNRIGCIYVFLCRRMKSVLSCIHGGKFGLCGKSIMSSVLKTGYDRPVKSVQP